VRSRSATPIALILLLLALGAACGRVERELREWRDERRVDGIQQAATAGGQPWAGVWTRGPVFPSATLWLAPNEGWAWYRGSCFGVPTLESGRLEVDAAQVLVLRSPDPAGGTERLRLACYGGAPRLVPAEAFDTLVNALVAEAAGGPAVGDAFGLIPEQGSRLPSGHAWDLADAARERVETSPRAARVVSETAPWLPNARPLRFPRWTRSTLVDVGRADGAWEGLLLHPPGCAAERCLRLVRVGRAASELEALRPVAEIPLEVPSLRGSTLSVVCER